MQHSYSLDPEEKAGKMKIHDGFCKKQPARLHSVNVFFFLLFLQHLLSNLGYSLGISEIFFPILISRVSVAATQELS